MYEKIAITAIFAGSISSMVTYAITIAKSKKQKEKDNSMVMNVITGEDKLNSLFDMQKELQKNFYEKELPADEPNIMGNNILALLAELGEVMQEDKRWKNWCKNPPTPNFKNKKKEIIDCIHFMINICLYSGMDANEMYNLFTNKNKENITRQKNNY
ncbi:dUTPase [Acidithiobacillus sp.]|uniref:dUTPase n=1 Tax=Acidithiobacillus sp. TaxID=1872118 RepID=UPI00356A2689